MKNNTRFFLLFIQLFFLTSSAFSQYALEDAIKIEQITRLNHGKFPLTTETSIIFERYFGKEENSDKYLPKIDSNPFLDSIFVIKDASADKDLPESLKFKSAVSGIGNIPVTNFAVGLADFLVERTKTELNTAFFRRFKEELNDNKYKDLKLLFPETTSLLNVIGIEIYQFDHYLNALRSAFVKDLRNLLNHLPAVLDRHQDEAFFTENKEVIPSLRLALELAGWIREERHPGEILALLADSDNSITLSAINEKFQSAVSSVRFMALLSESLRSADDEEHFWVTSEQLRKLKTERVFKIYLGLLYELSKKAPYDNIRFPIVSAKESSAKYTTIRDLLSILAEHQENIYQYRVFITELGQEAQSVMSAISTLKQVQKNIMADATISNQVKQQQLLDASSDVFNGMISIMKKGLELKKLPYIKIDTTISNKVVGIIGSLEKGGSIALSIAQKQYSASVSQLVQLLDELLNKGDENNKKTLKKVLKYGTFMANIVEADSPEQAQKAIEAVALPPGSYTIKRESRFSVALNGYVGVFAGDEYILNVHDKRWINNVAVTAPVGISVSWGNICPDMMRPWSIGLFAPIIDLGAVASYRFGNAEDTVNGAETIPTIQLKDIVAPGIFLEIGIGGTPLSFAVGRQFGSRLRKIENESGKVGDTYQRLGATLKVDIPIVHFYASPGKK